MAPDPLSEEEVRLFHPRRDRWQDRFGWEGVTLLGKTPIGRATIAVLEMNRPLILAIRREELLLARHPPPEQSDPDS